MTDASSSTVHSFPGSRWSARITWLNRGLRNDLLRKVSAFDGRHQMQFGANFGEKSMDAIEL